jgi:hypothetical protein
MNEATQRIFLLYFTGYTQTEIAQQCDTTLYKVHRIISENGLEWVSKYLKQEYKDTLIALSQTRRSSEQIAEIMGKPWSRWLVLWTLKHIAIQIKSDKILAKLNNPGVSTTKNVPAHAEVDVATNQKQYKIRCQRCSSEMSLTAIQMVANPDRLCQTCIDHRETDRRRKRD